jgi:hypothetical protein
MDILGKRLDIIRVANNNNKTLSELCNAFGIRCQSNAHYYSL